ncbi:metallophosphoesterase [Algibacter mikhailovii]|uniref:Metallophosphoesterase n=1 Tax=Algibacter mikhailovii TaxID=425498 RepID=A0A918R7W5_9FLAO|nr:metallophosphoesterase [Algibacter mikhailovii]GGZ87052.1 metallophosphoesterase [Algibacter mikhailovii]
MIKIISLLLFCLFAFALISSGKTYSRKASEKTVFKSARFDTIPVTDGPYVFITGDSIIEKKINNGVLKTQSSALSSIKSQFDNASSTYTNASKIAALSDVHGQFDLTKTILVNNSIIDADENWAYGDGHLVIVGDVFDRGPKVTELLWLIYKLEKQAEQAGGKVHYLLGNHEYMVMRNDLRYINKKYRKTERILRTHYNELYGNETLLGRWLRSKATILQIDNYLFVHGGISLDFIDSGVTIETANQKMRASLLDEATGATWDSIYFEYNNTESPIWYRGYFSEAFKKGELKKILKSLKVDHIIVGHTSQEQIESLFNNKILAVDTSIKNGVSGEILFIENGLFYRGLKNGKKVEIVK